MKPGSLTIALFLLCSFTACRPGPEVSEQGSISASAPAPATTSAANPETAATAVPETASTTATPGNSGPSLSTDAPGRISEQEQDALAPPTLYGYRVVRSYPHDPEAFTQGFTYHEGLFYEGTGLEGASSLRVVRPETGEVLKLHQLPPDIFGEGITLAGDRIVQVSWKNQQAFIYDRQTLKPIQRLRYAMAEGWGITYDGTRLIMSDGSANLYFLHPGDLSETGRITVREQGQPVDRLNELEYIQGEVWANIWGSDDLVRIQPATGRVTGRIKLKGLLPASERTPQTDVLNGIAFDAAAGRIFVTGKNWPRVFEIEVRIQ